MTAHDWCAALRRLDGAYSDNTIRTYRTDVQAYETGAHTKGVEPFPAGLSQNDRHLHRGAGTP